MEKVYVITGCSTKNSLGYKIAEQIKKMDNENDSVIVALANENDCEMEIHVAKGGSVDAIATCDLTKNYDGIVSTISKQYPEIYCLINCAGLNGNYWFEDITDENFDEIIDVNLKSIYKVSQALLTNITKAKGTILNIVSNAARVPMRCSSAYNASKSGAQMLTYQMARELTLKNEITVFSVSPNKLRDTKMSKYIDKRIPEVRGWSEKESSDYQSSGLTTGVETDPEVLSEFIAFLLSTKQRHFFLSGCDIHYGS